MQKIWGHKGMIGMLWGDNRIGVAKSVLQKGHFAEKTVIDVQQCMGIQEVSQSLAFTGWTPSH